MDLDELRDEVIPFMLWACARGDDSYAAILTRVQRWHEGKRDAERLTYRRAFVAQLVIDGWTQTMIAKRLGESVRTVGRDVEALREAFGGGV